jgi:hypothetical protein
MRNNRSSRSGKVERLSGLSAALRTAALIAMGGIAAMAAARSGQPAPARPVVPPATLSTQTAPLAVGEALRPGLWEVRFTDGGGEVVQRLCLGDPALLLQIRHQRAGCGRLVLTNDPDSATVQYSCPGAGWGRTSLRAMGHETARIETQGIAANSPFSFSAVAKRTGECVIAQAH